MASSTNRIQRPPGTGGPFEPVGGRRGHSEAGLRTLEIAEARLSLAMYARRLRKEPVIVTDRGKPLMVLVPVEKGADVESVSLR